MIEIRSYLRTAEVQFTPVADINEAPSNPRYVEGAIELSVDGTPIIDRAMWDYVDQLWAYIADMVLSLRAHDHASTYFPDQPIKLSFQRTGKNRVLVTLEIERSKRVATIEEHELVDALRAHGTAFFDKMTVLLPENAKGYAEATKRLNSPNKD